jgi:antitoxin component HigA of HigAB toxin-antitoxin module
MKNLSEIRNLSDYAKVIDLLLTHYVKSEEFATSSERERSDIVDSCNELKNELCQAGPLNTIFGELVN